MPYTLESSLKLIKWLGIVDDFISGPTDWNLQSQNRREEGKTTC